MRGHTVDFIIRGGSLYPCTNDNSSQWCAFVCVCVCVCVGGGCSNNTPSSGLPFEKCFFFFYCNSNYFVACLLHIYTYLYMCIISRLTCNDPMTYVI